MTVPNSTSLPTRMALIVVAAVLAVGLAALVSFALAPFVSLLALAVVPSGLIYGAVVRVALLRARRAAAEVDSPVDEKAAAAADHRSTVQRLDQGLNVALLALYPLIAVVVVLDYGFGAATSRVPGFAGLLGSAVTLLLVLAIPTSAVLTTMLATARPLIDGEAYALRTGGRGADRIRRARRVSCIAFGLHWTSALALIITFPILVAAVA